MNNTDFRRLVQDRPSSQPDAPTATLAKPTTNLGSRNRSSIPMTPRTVKGGSSVDFARQLAEQNAISRPQKKFRSATAPKGAKLAAGYTDRALNREANAESQDDMEARVTALEQQMKLGQIDRDVFEQLRDQITGGEIGATHLIKGLDRKLLERVRKGENVVENPKAATGPLEDVRPLEPDAEEELGKLEQQEIIPVHREEMKKTGTMAPPPPVIGQKRTRNDILAEWKASRQAEEAAKAAANLGTRFKKVNAKQPQSRIEKDEHGREVLITVDEDGRVKRKIRHIAKPESREANKLAMPDKSATILGMAVPEVAAQSKSVLVEQEEDDIFEGVGDFYDPLAMDKENDDDGDVSGDDEPSTGQNRNRPAMASTKIVEQENDESKAESLGHRLMPPPERTVSGKKNNYFSEQDDQASEDLEKGSKGVIDSSILESLKRAAAIREASSQKELGNESDELSSAAKRLFQRDRDLDDIDMGFGSSRFGDEDGEDGGKVKLSEWNDKSGKGDDNEAKASRGNQQKKSGKKKFKGDKNSATDILKAIERKK